MTTIANLVVGISADLTQFQAGLAAAKASGQAWAQSMQQASAAATGLTASERALNSALDTDLQHERALQLVRASGAEAIRIHAAALDQLHRASQAAAADQSKLAAVMKLTQAEELALARSEQALAQQQAAQAARTTAQVEKGLLRGASSGFGLGIPLLGGLTTGLVTVATREVIRLGEASAQAALDAQKIGVAFDASAKQAGASTDGLIAKLREASRGTISDTGLEQLATGAFNAGIGGNAQQVADLLALARQKGKEFGTDTTTAFKDVTSAIEGLSTSGLAHIGIVVNEQQAYASYAASLGVMVGHLDDQQKRQALVNQILKDNTQLIKDNATASLDAADQIDRANARIQAANERTGKALIPAKVVGSEAVAGLADVATGGMSVSQFAAGFANAGTLIRLSVLGTFAPLLAFKEIIQDVAKSEDLAASAASKMSAADDLNAFQAQFGDDRRESITSYERAIGTLPPAIDAVGRSAALNAGDLTQLGDSLKLAEAQALRPYKDAVDAAKTALDASTKVTDAAKASVADYDKQLSAAKQHEQELASTRVTGTKAAEDAIFAAQTEQAQAQARLAAFKAPGAGLDQALSPIQAQIDATKASLPGYKTAFDNATAAVKAQQRVVDQDNRALQDNEAALSKAKTAYDDLKTTISDNTTELEKWRKTALAGTGAFDAQIGSLGTVAQSIQLRLDNLKLSGAPATALKGLEDQLARVQLQAERTNLQKSLALGPQEEAIKDFGKAGEQTFDQIMAGMQHAQANIDTASAALGPAKTALDDATAARDASKVAVDNEKRSLDDLNQTLDTARTKYEDQKSHLSDLKTQLDDTRTAAIKPFQDAIDTIGVKVDNLQLAKRINIDPFNKAIDDAAHHAKELDFKTIIDGLKTTNDQITILSGKRADAQAALDKAQAAQGQEQALYDSAKTALDEQQKYFDKLSQGLDDLKLKLSDAKDIWGDLGTLIAAINQANASGGGNQSWNAGGGPVGMPRGAGSIDAILQGTGLAGLGDAISAFASKYSVPVSLALSMFKQEAEFAKPGSIAAMQNNPGNLRGSPLEIGERNGFAVFADMRTGIEAYFKLLHDSYSQFLNPLDLQGLIGKYAPGRDGNDVATYIDHLNRWMAEFSKDLGQAAVYARTFTRGSVSEEIGPEGRGGARDPILSDEAIDLILRGGRQTGSYHGDRTQTGGVDTHFGVDIAGVAGMDVRAPHGGHVVFAGPNSFGGTAVIMENDAGEQWYFGHLRGDIGVHVGSDVTAGDVIGHINPDFNHVHVQEKIYSPTTGQYELQDPTQTLENIAAGKGAGAIPDRLGGSAAAGPTAAAAAQSTAAAGAGLPTAGSSFVQDASQFFAFVQQGIDTLNQIRRYHGVPREAVLLFANDIYGTVTTFEVVVRDFDRQGMAAALQWTQATGAMLATIDTGMTILGELKKYKGITRDEVLQFANDLYGFITTFAVVVENFDREALAAGLQWNTAATQLLASVDSGIASLTAISKYRGVTRNEVLQFGNDLYATVATLGVIVRDFDRDAMADAVEWEMSAGQVLTIIGQGVDALTSVAKYRGVPQGAVALLASDVRQAVLALEAVAASMDPDAVAAAATFAGSAGQVLSTLGSGVTTLQSVDGYIGIAPDALAALQGDMGLAIKLMQDMAAKSDTEGVAAAAAFADSTGRIIAPISTAYDTLTKIADYKGVGRNAVLLIENDINGVVQTMAVIVRNTRDQGVAAAVDFADATGKILAPIKLAMDTLTAMGKYKGVSRDAVLLIGYDILGTIETFAVIAREAGKGDTAKAATWTTQAGRFLDGLTHVEQGLTSLGKYKGMDPKGLQRLMNDYNAVVKASVQQSTVTMDQVWAQMNTKTNTAWQTWFKLIEEWAGKAVLVMGDDARQIGALAGDIVSSVNRAKHAVDGLHVPSGGGGNGNGGGGNDGGNVYTFRVPGLSTLGQRATQQRSQQSRPVQLFQQNYIDSEQLAQHLASRTASELARRLR